MHRGSGSAVVGGFRQTLGVVYPASRHRVDPHARRNANDDRRNQPHAVVKNTAVERGPIRFFRERTRRVKESGTLLSPFDPLPSVLTPDASPRDQCAVASPCVAATEIVVVVVYLLGVVVNGAVIIRVPVVWSIVSRNFVTGVKDGIEVVAAHFAVSRGILKIGVR